MNKFFKIAIALGISLIMWIFLIYLVKLFIAHRLIVLGKYLALVVLIIVCLVSSLKA